MTITSTPRPPAFDAADYAAYCAGTPDPLPLDDWRRRNVDALVTLCRETAQGYGVRFGIAPQGDPALNYSAQYSDAARWLAEGMVDYLMPQLYWGLDYTQDGDGSHALGALAARWLAMERAPGTALYFGLGAYRIGEGDGGDRSGPRQRVADRPRAGRAGRGAGGPRRRGRGAVPL